MKIAAKVYVGLVLTIGLIVISDLALIYWIHSDYSLLTRNMITNKIQGESKTILPHLYQISNIPHLRKIFDQYTRLGFPCLNMKDLNGNVLFEISKRSCANSIKAKNYIDQEVLSINFDFPEISIYSSIQNRKWLLLNILLAQTLLILMIFYILKHQLEVEKKSFLAINHIRNESKIKENLAILARQFAHDVRSPITALNMTLRDLSLLPEARRVIVRGSLTRINDIANNLLEKYRNPMDLADDFIYADSNVTGQILISSLIDSIVTEKRIQYNDQNDIIIDFSPTENSYGLFSNINASELKTIISNLINNSIESFHSAGKIIVSISRRDDHVEIKVRDNGKGIPKSLIESLGKSEKTYGKKMGNGIGLLNAKKAVVLWDGKFNIESTEGQGTEISIVLPICETPSWFVPFLVIKDQATVVILDDDTSIHQVWNERINKNIHNSDNIKLVHLYSINEARSWFLSNKLTPQTVFLSDLEIIGESCNGINIIEEFNLMDYAILVTSRFEEKVLREKCQKINLRLIPKTLAEFVPIFYENHNKYSSVRLTPSLISNLKDTFSDKQIIYIEDDKYLRMGWEISAKRHNINLLTFSSSNDFQSQKNTISKDSFFFIDNNLGKNEVQGIVLAKALYLEGYKNLYLATGFEADYFPDKDFLKGIVCKNPPWDDTGSD